MSEQLLRQWALLQQIPRAPRKIDGATLEHRLKEHGFQVERRMVQRDLNIVSAAFPIVCDKKHKPYGWSWARNAAPLSVPGLDPHTALTFRLVSDFLTHLMPRATLRYLDPHLRAAREALSKLKGARLRTWPRKVRVLPLGPPLMPPKIEPKVLEVVYDALMEERCFEVRYVRRGADSPKLYTLHPLGLVFRNANIYVVCTHDGSDALRTLVLHRMQSATLLDLPRSSPPGFDLDAFIRENKFSYPVGDKPLRLVLRFTHEVGLHLYESALAPDQRLTDEGSHIVLRATVADTSELRWWIRGFGDQVEVRGPPRLRREFQEAADRVAAMYAGPS